MANLQLKIKKKNKKKVRKKLKRNLAKTQLKEQKEILIPGANKEFKKGKNSFKKYSGGKFKPAIPYKGKSQYLNQQIYSQERVWNDIGPAAYDDSIIESGSYNIYAERFCLKHTFRAGAIIWAKDKGRDYYLVFKSLSRPIKGTQLPGGRVERRENTSYTVIREVREETGLETRIVCPLGFFHVYKPEDNYSNLQIFYIVRPLYPINVHKKWKFIDRDRNHQELECWFEPITKNPSYLALQQDKVVNMFKNWLDEHKKTSAYNKKDSQNNPHEKRG